MSKFKANNYITVPGFAIVNLKLKGNELLTFSIIYGFTQNTSDDFTGSISYIAEALNVSRNTAINTLDKLIEKGFLVKKQFEYNSVVFNKYNIGSLVYELIEKNEVWGGSAKIDEGSAKTAPGGSANFGRGSAKIGYNNTIYNTNLNNTNNSTISENENLEKKSKVIKDFNLRDFEKILKEKGADEQLIADYLSFRKKNRFSISLTVCNSLLKECEIGGIHINDALSMIVEKSWRGFKSTWYLNELKKNEPAVNLFEPNFQINR